MVCLAARLSATSYLLVPPSSPTQDDGSVSLLDLDNRAVIQTIAVGNLPSAATVDSDAHTVYVTNNGGASVSVINSVQRAVTDTVDVRDGPQTVAAGPSTHTAWVLNFRDNSISVIER